MLARVFLFLSALIWLPYGLLCLMRPEYLREAAGVVATSPTGTTELRAMYGGLQTALGALALAGGLRGALKRSALTALATLCTGLGSARLLGAILDGGFSGYTYLGLCFEWTSAVLATWLLRRGA